jgi:hypothetical protein
MLGRRNNELVANKVKGMIQSDDAISCRHITHLYPRHAPSECHLDLGIVLGDDPFLYSS